MMFSVKGQNFPGRSGGYKVHSGSIIAPPPPTHQKRLGFGDPPPSPQEKWCKKPGLRIIKEELLFAKLVKMIKIDNILTFLYFCFTKNQMKTWKPAYILNVISFKSCISIQSKKIKNAIWGKRKSNCQYFISSLW